MEDPQQVGPAKVPSRGLSFVLVGAAYATALATAAVFAAEVGHDRPLLTVLLAHVAGTVVIFLWSRVLNNSSLYDPYWSVAPPVIVLYLAWTADPDLSVARQVIVITVVCVWGARLTGNWARGWGGLAHEDWRYRERRGGAEVAGRHVPYWGISFAGFHLFPTVQVYLGCLALYPAVAVGTGDFGLLDIVAVVVGGGAVLLEMAADEQLWEFNRRKRPGEICTDGVWAWSRHPNYLGELGFWWALWLFGLSADPSWWWTVVGPVAMTAMFLFVSIPMLDRRSRDRRPGYERHAARVPALVPLPWRRATAGTTTDPARGTGADPGSVTDPGGSTDADGATRGEPER